jgi:hypothetical protein
MLMESPESDLTLTKLDFPDGWINGGHPDDLKLLEKPLKPEWIWKKHRYLGRMWFRVSFRVEGGFLPASFLVSTGAPSWLWYNHQ